jgi:hypothetical protein
VGTFEMMQLPLILLWLLPGSLNAPKRKQRDLIGFLSIEALAMFREVRFEARLLAQASRILPSEAEQNAGSSDARLEYVFLGG